MPGKIKVSSTFRSVTSVRLKTSTGWGTVTKGFIKVAGQWKQWYNIPLRDTFTRTTSGNLGTSESFFSWSSLFGTWFANGSQAQSNNAVSSGTAGALSYLDIGTTEAVTSVGVTTGTGPAFWITEAGSWWGAVTTSDQTDTTYTYPCNCVCNGHNQTTCNTCTNPAFGTYSCPTTYPATGTTSPVLQGNATLVTTTIDQGAANPVYSSQKQGNATLVNGPLTYAGAATANYSEETVGPANATVTTTYSYSGSSTLSYSCPSGQTVSGTRCYTSTQSIAISSCFQTYGSGVVNSSQSCTSCYATVNGSNVFVGCCENGTNGAYRGCKAYAISTSSVDSGGATAVYTCPSGSVVGPNPSTGSGSVGSCYTGTTTTTYSCPSGQTLFGTNCTQPVFAFYSCPSGQTVSGSGCYTTSSSYSCSAFPGSTVVGSECYANVLTGYTCPAGQTVSGSRCVTSSSSYSCSAFSGSYVSGSQCYKDVTTYSCPSGGSLSGTTCTIAQTCNNSGTSCEYCGSTTTFIGGGTYPNCDSYGSTCQTCTAGAVVTNYYLQIIYSTSTGASYSVYSTSSGLSAQPATIGVTTSGNTATVVPRSSGGTSLGSFTATNTGTKGTNVGIVKSYGNYAQGSTADNFNSDQT
jgi:conjugal transfer mating pair stabilization protein TraN